MLAMAQSDYARILGGVSLGAFAVSCASKAAIVAAKSPRALQSDLAFLFIGAATLAGELGIAFYLRPSPVSGYAVSLAVVTLLLLHLLFCALIAGAVRWGALWRTFALGALGTIVLLGVVFICSWPWLGPTFLWAAGTVLYWALLGLLPIFAFDLVMVSSSKMFTGIADRSSELLTAVNEPGPQSKVP